MSSKPVIIPIGRNFPNITINVKSNPDKHHPYGQDYLAESTYSYWSPDNPCRPCRKTGYGKTEKEAIDMAIRITFNNDAGKYSNDKVFITDSSTDYENAIFVDGNGKTCTYTEAHRIISESNKNQ